MYICMSLVKIVAVFFFDKYECQLKKVYINYCTATHALPYYDNISNYSLVVYKNKACQTFGNLYVTLVINISLLLVPKSSVSDCMVSNCMMN